jgi:hypothetical protein
MPFFGGLGPDEEVEDSLADDGHDGPQRGDSPRGPRGRLRLTRVRVLSQIAFFVLFVLSAWATWTSRVGGYRVSRLLEFGPLVTLSTALATGYVYKFLGWGLLLVVITFLLGRVFCNWMCPYGTLHQAISWLFNVRGNSQRIRDNEHNRLQYLKYVTLNVFLIMASMGALQIGFLDPIVMMYRALTTVFAPHRTCSLRAQVQGSSRWGSRRRSFTRLNSPRGGKPHLRRFILGRGGFYWVRCC